MKSKKEITDNGFQILIVEDSPTQAENLRHLLEGKGYTVTAAANGRQGIAAARDCKPDLIISDIIMPEMDGYELCSQIRADKNFKDIPIILLTALSDPKDVIKGLECGTNNFIVKPYDEKYILLRIQNIFSNMKLRSEVKTEMGINIFFAGERYFIKSERLQILDLLLSTFENAYHKNLELNETQKQLTRLNEQLEQRVEERTIKIKAEVARRMQAEEVLKESERYTRGLFEVNLDPLVTISAKGKITDVNHATEVITGMSSKEIIGTDFSNYFTNPDSARKGYKQVFSKGFVRNYPLEIKHHDGKVTPVLFNASVYKDMEGRIAGCFAAARDITKIKQAEEELKKYQDHLEELVKERTAELEKKNKELKRFNKLFVGREFRIKELKNKVKELEKELRRKKQ